MQTKGDLMLFYDCGHCSIGCSLTVEYLYSPVIKNNHHTNVCLSYVMNMGRRKCDTTVVHNSGHCSCSSDNTHIIPPLSTVLLQFAYKRVRRPPWPGSTTHHRHLVEPVVQRSGVVHHH